MALLRRRKGHPGHRRGQAIAEFALALPIIVLLLCAVFDLGRGVWAYNTITDAARHGARVAIVNQMAPDDTVTMCAETMPVELPLYPNWSPRACAAQTAAALGVTVDDVTVAYSTPAGSTLACTSTLDVGCLVTVTVTYQWQPMTPVISSFLGPIAMRAVSQMPVERVFP